MTKSSSRGIPCGKWQNGRKKMAEPFPITQKPFSPLFTNPHILHYKVLQSCVNGNAPSIKPKQPSLSICLSSLPLAALIYSKHILL
jgi:hypothetical protein